jgi:hypothetical protein
MRKSDTFFILAVTMFLLSLIEALSGFLLWLVIPRGGGKRGLEEAFWSLSRDTWIDIHDWAAVGLLVIVIIHIIFHWKWLVHMYNTCCPFVRRTP